MSPQCEHLIDLFRLHGFRMTLGQLLDHSVGYKCTSRFSDLRKLGYKIDCVKGKLPSQNLYIMAPPEKTGQGRLFI
jgi:hypothetical protein